MPPPPPQPPSPITRSGHRPLIGVSTKMYFTHARTTSYLSSLLALLSESESSSLFSKLDPFLIPDFLSLYTTLSQITASPPPLNTILVGAQDCATEDFGAYTGEVSPAVLREMGVGIVEVGHAERRRLFGETDEVVRDKVRAVVRNGMVPLVCVGEEGRIETGIWGGREGEMGITVAAEEVVRQVGVVMEGLEEGADVVLAYEPVWAIGAAEPASAEYVRGVVRRVRESEVVKGRKGRTRIVYGGAAGPGLWGRLRGEVDGLFLGRFAHDPEQFVKILYEVAGMELQP